jgi:hypothetical protein
LVHKTAQCDKVSVMYLPSEITGDVLAFYLDLGFAQRCKKIVSLTNFKIMEVNLKTAKSQMGDYPHLMG